MANTVQHKRGTTAQVNSYTGAVGEFIYNITTKRIHAQDGATAGGIPHALVSDVDLKANASVTISAGAGLTGGGTLAANRTLALSSASIASLALADSAVQPDVLDDYATLAQLAAKFDNPSGTTSQYIRGDGSLATFPSIPQGTVTSVGMTAPTGFSVSGSPVTSTGTLSISYAAGYQGYTTAEANKLAGVQAGAQVNTVNSVAGKTGAVTLVKADVGLGNVDNTSDASKPISTATQTALNAKANSAVTITAGSGLTGGGDLTANRTVSLNSASIASLAKADTATQPSDLGALATKDQISVADISATGSPSNTTYLRGDGTWGTPSGGSGGPIVAADITDSTSLGRSFITLPDTSRERFIYQAANNTVAAVNATTFLGKIGASDFGVGQTWQDVTASRSVETAYVNNTGKTISVAVSVTLTAGGFAGLTNSDGSIGYSAFSAGQDNDMSSATLTAIIPNGGSYKVVTTFADMYSWVELR